MKRTIVGLTTFLFVLGTVLVPLSSSAAPQVLTVYSDQEGAQPVLMPALVAAFQKKYPDIHTTLTVAPAGVARPHAVSTMLQNGTMSDVFSYYAGSLLQSIGPSSYLTDLSGEPWITSIIPSFFPSVSIGSAIYGAPIGGTVGGGILYNKTVYSKLKLKIPLTWTQFMANNAIITRAGIIPVVETFHDQWTSQLLILADAYNLLKAYPSFPDLYTANRVAMATTPMALEGFQHLEEVHRLQYMNSDYKTATLAQGLQYLANGQAAHFPMLSLVEPQLRKSFPNQVNNIGMFAEPGPTATVNGLTVWMPDGLYIPNSSKNLTAAKKFVAFAVSADGIAAMRKADPNSGPYLEKIAKVSSNASSITTDINNYLKQPNGSAPALEFLTPVKGPNLPKIAVQVGTGILSGVAGAKAYDADVRAESARIGLPGWGKLPN